MTDGLLPKLTVKGFRYVTSGRIKELTRPCALGSEPLWERHDIGFKVHDYLEWNPSKDEEIDRREASRVRMVFARTSGQCSQNVPDMEKEKVLRTSSSEKKKEVRSGSKRPIYTSDRFAVFEWQLDELGKVLGSHLDAFDLHAFFDELSRQSRTDGLVIPTADVWLWLQAQVVAEARRRGLPMVVAVPDAVEAMWDEIKRKGPSIRP